LSSDKLTLIKINNRKVKMMYLILKEIEYENMDNTYRVVDQINDLDKANDMLQGYKLIERDKTISYSILKYEKPLILKKEVA
jgi:hypothetical protein